MTRLRRIMRKVARAILIVLAILIVVEVGLRIAGFFYLRHLYARQPVPGGINVVCLGESSTEGLWVDPADTYPWQLQELLRRQYPKQDIAVIVPPHVGQNTSQIANRTADYMERYHPRLVVVMVGINNEWALRESNIGKFVRGKDSFGVKTRIALEELRVYKLLRYCYMQLSAHNRDDRDYARHEGLAVYGH